MNVEASLTIWQDIEDLRKPELICSIHLQVSAYKHYEATLYRPVLHIIW